MFWLFDHNALGILVPWSGIEPATSAWEGHILSTEPPGKSPRCFLKQARKSRHLFSLTHPKLLEQCLAQSWLNEWPNQEEDSSLHLPCSHWVNTATNLKLREEKQAVVRKAVTDNYTGKTPKGFENEYDRNCGLPRCHSDNLSTNAEDTRHTSSIPRSGRSPGRGHGNPLQYSCLDNPMDRGD